MVDRVLPTIANSYDDAKLGRDGRVTEITRVRVMYGDLGPFELELPRVFTETELNAAIDARLAPFGWRRY